MQMKTEPCSGTGVVADDGKNLTPGMRQYREIKAQYPDAILFFHIGDFFETLEGDAEIVSRELDLVLTSRSKNGDRRIPLAGVPHHAGEGYIARLVAKGYKVAICEQTEDPKTAKGLVKREVIRVITPGTVIDPAMLPSSAAAYLMAIAPGTKGGDWGMALLDISTGEFSVSALPAGGIVENIRSEIARYRPAECVVPSTADDESAGMHPSEQCRRDTVRRRPVPSGPGLSHPLRSLQGGNPGRLRVRRDAGRCRGGRSSAFLCGGDPEVRPSAGKQAFCAHVRTEHDARCSHAAQSRSAREHPGRHKGRNALFGTLTGQRPRWAIAFCAGS